MNRAAILSIAMRALILLAALLACGNLLRTLAIEYRQPYGHDLLLFAQAGQRFWQTGELYERSADPAYTYRPGAPVFKFPPPYQFAITPWMTQGMPDSFFWHAKTWMLLVYGVTLLLLFHLSRPLLRSSGQAAPRNPALLLAGLVLAFGAGSAAFTSAFGLLTAEIPLLLLLIAALALSRRHPLLAGLLIAYAASCKLYPVFMLSYFLLLREWRVLIGFALGLPLIGALSVALFGWQEHHFYLSQILPVLLQEGVVSKPQNLNLIHALARIELLTGTPEALSAPGEPSARLWQGLRAGLLIASAAGFWCYRSGWLAHRELLLAWLLLIMLLCLANYWLQYLLYLLPAQISNGLPCLSWGCCRRGRCLKLPGYWA